MAIDDGSQPPPALRRPSSINNTTPTLLNGVVFYVLTSFASVLLSHVIRRETRWKMSSKQPVIEDGGGGGSDGLAFVCFLPFDILFLAEGFVWERLLLLLDRSGIHCGNFPPFLSTQPRLTLSLSLGDRYLHYYYYYYSATLYKNFFPLFS